MENNMIADKSKAFAIRIINLYKHISISKKETVLSRQILRSGTSIGANVREALRAQSTADFIAKLSISLGEADETAYWLELLQETEYITEVEFKSIYTDCNELIKLLVCIINTKKANIKPKN